MLYILVVVGVSFLIYQLNIYVDELMAYRGAILGFLYLLMMPIVMHLKCVYYDRSSGFIRGGDESNMEIRLNSCECDVTYASKWTLWIETAFLILSLLLGAVIMVSTLVSIAQGDS